MPRAHQAGFSRRRSLAGVGFFKSVRCHGPGLTNGDVQQQETQLHCFGYVMYIFGNLALRTISGNPCSAASNFGKYPG
ncbi:hypothetical protein TNCV_965281 [Trichonephila clavipes]|nr:hypothetical protein TNCV_965281 [Trichonephila clavipes]